MSAVAEITETTTTEMPTPIVFTDSAAAKVADLIADEAAALDDSGSSGVTGAAQAGPETKSN